MRLWLDDIRPSPPGFDVHVKTAPDAIRFLESGKIDEVSLDHDLGEGDDPEVDVGTGYDVAVWIEAKAHDGTLPRLVWNVHSANPVGRQKMEIALQNADRFWGEHESKREAAMNKPPKMIRVGEHVYKLAMDPDFALDRARETAETIVEDQSESMNATQLAETFLGLDEWFKNAGFYPAIWEARRGKME